MTSVLDTQERLFALKREAGEGRLSTLGRQIEAATEKHRTQIAASLESKDAIERQMAQSIAEFWDVPLSIPETIESRSNLLQ